MTGNELFKKWTMAIAEFNIDEAKSTGQELKLACEAGDGPDWSEDEEMTFWDFIEDVPDEVNAQLRGKVLHQSLSRLVKSL